MESNLHLDPLCGEPYPIIKSLPDIYNQRVSCLDDSSKNYKKYRSFPMDENLYKQKTSGENG